MKKDVAYCAVILSLLVAVCVLASRRPVAEVVQTVRVDTVFYERPQPVRISDKLRPIRIPKFLFARAETDSVSGKKVSAVPDSAYLTVSDSVDLMIEHRTVEYADSNYRAVVSGPALGDYGPQLDRFEVFPRTVVRTQTVTKRNRFAVVVGPSVSYGPKGGLQLTVSVSAGFVLYSK